MTRGGRRRAITGAGRKHGGLSCQCHGVYSLFLTLTQASSSKALRSPLDLAFSIAAVNLHHAMHSGPEPPPKGRTGSMMTGSPVDSRSSGSQQCYDWPCREWPRVLCAIQKLYSASIVLEHRGYRKIHELGASVLCYIFLSIRHPLTMNQARLWCRSRSRPEGVISHEQLVFTLHPVRY